MRLSAVKINLRKPSDINKRADDPEIPDRQLHTVALVEDGLDGLVSHVSPSARNIPRKISAVKPSHPLGGFARKSLVDTPELSPCTQTRLPAPFPACAAYKPTRPQSSAFRQSLRPTSKITKMRKSNFRISTHIRAKICADVPSDVKSIQTQKQR